MSHYHRSFVMGMLLGRSALLGYFWSDELNNYLKTKQPTEEQIQVVIDCLCDLMKANNSAWTLKAFLQEYGINIEEVD